MTVFKKIIDRKIPATILYEDPLCLAFRDIHPQAPIHILLIPKKEIASLAHAQREDQSLLGHLMITAQEIAKKEGFLDQGFRVVINTGSDGGQEVPHLHLHLLAGRGLKWPPG